MRGKLVRALGLGVALTAAVMVSAGWTEAVPDPADALDAPAALPRDVARDRCEPAPNGSAEGEPTNRLVGQVAALDAQQGRIVLATRQGPVAVAADADTIRQLDVGDIVVVEITGDSADAPSEACPE